MHEAGVARAIAAEIRERDLASARLRVVVTGGHDEPAAFDDSLRLHLALELPDVDVGAIEIVHAPEARLCGTCATPFSGIAEDACPACGGAGLTIPTPERVELEWLEPTEGSRIGGDGPPPGS
jgi:hypothetical protein